MTKDQIIERLAEIFSTEESIKALQALIEEKVREDFYRGISSGLSEGEGDQ